MSAQTENTTQLPWKVLEIEGDILITAPDLAESTIAIMAGDTAGAEVNLADAALIVQAVNHHEALCNALRWALDQVPDDLDLEHQAALEKAKETLNQATTCQK